MVALVHARIAAAVAPGVTPRDLDVLAADTMRESGARPSFLGHHGFPGHICASVNDAVVHGIPDYRPLRDGDIISVDVGAIVGGFHGDAAWTYPVGDVSPDVARLLADTRAALMAAIAAAVPGNRLGAIGHAVERYARPRGYGVVEGYGGHGIGREMWEDPHVPNLGDPATGVTLRAGMTLAIEPMLTLGSPATRVLGDNWTVVTSDGSPAAHFEHTVAIGDGAPELLTVGVGEMAPAGLTERPIAVVN